MPPLHTIYRMTEENKRSSATVIILVALFLVAAVGYGLWSSLGARTAPQTRTVSDFIVNWECLACGHRTEDRAGSGPHKCPKCGKDEMYAVIAWSCPRHGAKPVFFQYSDEGKPSKVKIAGGDWIPAFNDVGNWNIRCPECNGPMMPAETARPADDEPGD